MALDNNTVADVATKAEEAAKTAAGVAGDALQKADEQATAAAPAVGGFFAKHPRVLVAVLALATLPILYIAVKLIF
jgi:hypothetical protein